MIVVMVVKIGENNVNVGFRDSVLFFHPKKHYYFSFPFCFVVVFFASTPCFLSFTTKILKTTDNQRREKIIKVYLNNQKTWPKPETKNKTTNSRKKNEPKKKKKIDDDPDTIIIIILIIISTNDFTKPNNNNNNINKNK